MADSRGSSDKSRVGASGTTGAVTGADAAPTVTARRGRRRDPASGRPIGQSSPWVPALMVTCFLLGLIWLVAYYLAGAQIPVMDDLGNWNLLIGLGVIAVGFVVSTQWK